MKRLLPLFLFAATFLSKSGFAQLLPPNQPEQNACTPLILCGNSFTTPFGYQGIGTVSDMTTSPCGGGEANSMWMLLSINTPGTIVFEITPLTATDDYDYAVVNITNSSCSTFTQADVIRCNFNNNNPVFNNGKLGLNTTSTQQFQGAGLPGGSYQQQITANAGDVYLIMINNFGTEISPNVYAPSNGFTIDFTGSTATFNGTNPSMDYVAPSCNNSQQITVQMNTNVKCNSIAANGSDFTVTGGGSVVAAVGTNCANPNGYTKTLVLSFASPLPPGTYTLGVQNGSDGNTILDLCNVPLALTDTIQFVIDPYVPPAFVAIDTPACSEIRIKMNTRIRCDSIARNGSDFSITGPQANSIIAAYGKGCDTLNFTDTVVLYLQNPLQTDGTYSITAKKGTDGNTNMDSCGLYQPVGDAIALIINSYDGLILSSPGSVLCKEEYIQLDAANFSVPPPVAVNCDVSPITCTGNMYVAFAGTKDSSTDVNTPFAGAVQDARAQYLYRASELRAMGLKAGSIKTLEWKVTQKLSTLAYSNFTIKIGCTQANDITGNFINGNQVVYTDIAYATVPGWNTISLTTPYNWDGESNLVIEVCYDNSGVSANDKVAHSATSYSSVVRQFGNGLSGCTITTQGSSQTTNYMRPRLRFHICEPPAGTPAYAWSPGGYLSDSTIQQPIAFINRNVDYEVMVVDKYGCAHRDTTSYTLSIRQPVLKPLEATICLKEKVQLEASGGVIYNWLAVDPTTLSCLACPNPMATPTESTVYSVIIKDQYDCADTLHSNITVNPLPVVAIHPDDTVIKYGRSLQLNGSGAFLYHWYPSSAVSNPNLSNPIAFVTRPVTIILSGFDEKGCVNTDSIRIDVDYKDQTFIPTAFSPNGDGKNDLFKVGSISFQKLLEFRVFNRWGQEVFTTTDPQQGWDGKYKGVLQDVGTYHYIIRVAYPDSRVETFKGDVTLVK